MLIRKARPEDVEGIIDLNMKMAEETENVKLDRKVVRKGVEAVIIDNQKGFYLVAEETAGNRKIVGQLMITFQWSDWKNKCFWWINNVYVDEKYRKQNIFSQLYRSILEIARSKKDIRGLRLHVEKQNRNAKQVYESLGMIKIPYEVYETNV